MKFETDVKPTPRQLAEAFWEMYNGEQAYNQRERKNNASGRTGVYQKEDGKWWAEIQNKGKTEWLGTFSTFEDACEARELKELEYYGYSKE